MIKHVSKICIVVSLIALPTVFAFGGSYEPLTPIPLYESGSEVQIETALQVFFAISVAVAAVLAVIMLAIGGFRYMTSESAFNMGDAKKQITGAIVGLFIVLTAVLILRFINPDIVTMGNLFDVPGFTTTVGPGNAGGEGFVPDAGGVVDAGGEGYVPTGASAPAPIDTSAASGGMGSGYDVPTSPMSSTGMDGQ